MDFYFQHREVCGQMAESDKIKQIVDSLKEKEKIEGSMIVPSHTIANPKTMMIESLHAYLTFSAMFSSVVTSYLAYIAKSFRRFSLPSQQCILSCLSILLLWYLFGYLVFLEDWCDIDLIAYLVYFHSFEEGKNRTEDEAESIGDGVPGQFQMLVSILKVDIFLNHINMPKNDGSHAGGNKTVVKRQCSFVCPLLVRGQFLPQGYLSWF